jgi:glycolate oxidase iron-sulfur subunit
MQHQIPISDLGSAGSGMSRAVTTCVHCGFCLAACPTYKVLGEEMDSPRGRIVLMKQALEGDLRDADVRPYVDRCLGCLACETACPSGVAYRELLVPFRARLEARGRSRHQRAFREALLTVLESPRLFRMAHAAARIGKLIARTLPAAVPARTAALLALMPQSLPASPPLPAHTPATGTGRARVALLAGCVQQALRPSINLATIRVLAANGVDVLVPRDQRCCGALAEHTGFDERAARLAAANRHAFPRDVDAVVTNAAGCGSAMKDGAGGGRYPAPVMDVTEFLEALGMQTPLALATPTRLAYHDACHLAHGQGIRSAPRRLLERVGNLAVVEIDDAEQCCGSAGLYNLEHPATAAELGRRKAAAIRATGAQLVAAGNIGCIAQIEAHLDIPVQHTIEVLESAL